MKVVTAKAVVCLCLWLTVCQVRGSYITGKMNKTIHNLLQHYRLTTQEKYDGKLVFSREPVVGKMEAKMVYMGGVLETYEKLIAQMLKQLPNPTFQTAATPAAGTASDAEAGGDVRTGLSYILKNIQLLKTSYYKEHEGLLQRLHALNHIKTDNAVTQRKALSELLWIYEEASSLPNIAKQRRRRRRQALRAKSHLRA